MLLCIYQNRFKNRDFSYPDRILVGIRDFQTKSGESRRDRDGWTVCKQSWLINTVYHLLVKNNKWEGRLKWEGGPLNFHPQKGGVIWEGGLNRGFMVNKIRSREVERREEERRGEERRGDLLPCPTSPLPSPSCVCYASYTWVQRVVHALNWSVYGRFLP